MAELGLHQSGLVVLDDLGEYNPTPLTHWCRDPRRKDNYQYPERHIEGDRLTVHKSDKQRLALASMTTVNYNGMF